MNTAKNDFKKAYSLVRKQTKANGGKIPHPFTLKGMENKAAWLLAERNTNNYFCYIGKHLKNSIYQIEKNYGRVWRKI